MVHHHHCWNHTVYVVTRPKTNEGQSGRRGGVGWWWLQMSWNSLVLPNPSKDRGWRRRKKTRWRREDEQEQSLNFTERHQEWKVEVLFSSTLRWALMTAGATVYRETSLINCNVLDSPPDVQLHSSHINSPQTTQSRVTSAPRSKCLHLGLCFLCVLSNIDLCLEHFSMIE